MRGQTWPSRFWTPLPQKRRHGGPSERPANRVVGAAIVAGGLAFSVSLYPLPDGPNLLYPFPPNHESSSDSQKVAGAKFLSYKNSGSFTLKLADMVKLVALNHDFPGFGADGLLDLAMTYGLPNVVRSLQLLDSLGPLRHSFPSVSRGGGGGGGGSSDVPGDLWPALMLLLDFLEQNPPSLAGGDGLRDLITNVFPKLAVSLGIPLAPTAPSPETQVSALVAAPEFTPIEAQNLAAPDPPVSGFAQAPVSAPVEGAVSASVESAAPASVEPAAPAPTEVPVSVSVEAPVSAPDPPSVSVPEPDPPSPDPPSSPAGGTDASSAGDSGGGSTGDSGGGSAGSSGGGSAGSSGGGSAGSSGGGSEGSSGGGTSGGE
ncbi:hypothetical protein HNP02_005263 [Mycobacterium sp. AZCC_0083]|nr:hypothetical protein [Mycobacterium sp. AZCC_0083]